MSQQFRKEEKIRFQHCDFAGIVFYPRYFVMINDLVEDWFDEALNCSFNDMHPLRGVPTVNINIDFKLPARLGDVMIKSLCVLKLGERSMTIGIEFSLNNQIILQGTGTLVHTQIDPETKQLKSIPWSNDLKEKILIFTN